MDWYRLKGKAVFTSILAYQNVTSPMQTMQSTKAVCKRHPDLSSWWFKPISFIITKQSTAAVKKRKRCLPVLLSVASSSSKGLFVYTSGCIIIIEDLHDGKQRHLLRHVEEISTLALQHDVQALASASGASDMVASSICIWDLQSGNCKKVFWS